MTRKWLFRFDSNPNVEIKTEIWKRRHRRRSSVAYWSGGLLHPYGVFICGNCAPRVLQPPSPPLTQLRFSFLIHSPLMGHFEQTKMVFFCLILPFFFAYPNNCCKSSFQKTVNNQIARVIFINWLLDKIRIRLFVNTNNWSSLIDDVN